MLRFVAGFTIFLYVCAVSGQQYPNYRLKGAPTDPSIAIGVISGGYFPPGSFSIGHGDDNENGDGGPGADYGVNHENSGNGQIYPNGNIRPTQSEGGYVHGQNDINNYGAPTGQPSATDYNVPLQNSGQKPIHPYDDGYYQNVPVKNSATRNRFYPHILDYIFSLHW